MNMGLPDVDLFESVSRPVVQVSLRCHWVLAVVAGKCMKKRNNYCR